MIIVKLKGGMGNQMFQYALGRALSIRNKTSLGLDTSFYSNTGYPVRRYDLNLFSIEAKILSRKEIPFLHRSYGNGFFGRVLSKIQTKILPNLGTEREFRFDKKVYNLGPRVYLDGYWQSYKYFEDIKDLIRKDFKLKDVLPKHIKELQSAISSKKSVCIHVRRGDYVGNVFHDVLDRSLYYQKALEHMPDAEEAYVFSDDIEWCKANLSFSLPTTFVSNEYLGERDSGHFVLMQSCTYFIIANSSFSWWAAWLGASPQKKVVAPKQWFADPSIDTSDLIPPEWIRI